MFVLLNLLFYTNRGPAKGLGFFMCVFFTPPWC